MSSELDDTRLLKAWRGGDRAAGTELFRRHFASVYLFFQSKLNEGIEDIVQQTFLACVEAGDRLDEIRSFKAYLLGIARYQLLRRLDAMGVSKRRDHLVHGSVYDSVGPSRTVAHREELRVLLQALRRLPVDLQIAVELFYWEQMPLLDIAAVLEIPEGTVKSRLFRAKDLLRKQIAQLDAGEEVLRSTIEDLDGWARSLREMLGSKLPGDDA
jgi:RNA polymerase sigma-70 factor (ECF subfamily)